mmetsp:Transcript_20765/g.59525  ORF Transcript_20765/g.59525 Transcript_20765/m.59525 type:complete len:237 (+) Transcript_20765:253-963(+)
MPNAPNKIALVSISVRKSFLAKAIGDREKFGTIRNLLVCCPSCLSREVGSVFLQYGPFSIHRVIVNIRALNNISVCEDVPAIAMPLVSPKPSFIAQQHATRNIIIIIITGRGRCCGSVIASTFAISHVVCPVSLVKRSSVHSFLLQKAKTTSFTTHPFARVFVTIGICHCPIAMILPMKKISDVDCSIPRTECSFSMIFTSLECATIRNGFRKYEGPLSFFFIVYKVSRIFRDGRD